MEKIKIGFQESQYNNDTKLYFENKETLFQASKVFDNLIGQTPDLKQFQKGFKAHAIEVIKSNHPEGTALGLTTEKLLHLYNYDLSKLEALETQYNFDLTKEPNETNYFIFAENEQELSRFKKCEALINAWNDLQKDFETPLKPNRYIYYKNSQIGQPLQANISFIKGN
jgi:hypothetical protein